MEGGKERGRSWNQASQLLELTKGRPAVMAAKGSKEKFGIQA
ncbi:hypothetical protein TIFTF001_039012 [Ficus carica]|uniref:Uncharacterized protein n=1 Tax=Ficus carica TaxID=3494 RepID=A0AA88JEM3_FICCA|nr:hypothetical protein TIFTF001_039012 [Ficus carica]